MALEKLAPNVRSTRQIIALPDRPVAGTGIKWKRRLRGQLGPYWWKAGWCSLEVGGDGILDKNKVKSTSASSRACSSSQSELSGRRPTWSSAPSR